MVAECLGVEGAIVLRGDGEGEVFGEGLVVGEFF